MPSSQETHRYGPVLMFGRYWLELYLPGRCIKILDALTAHETETRAQAFLSKLEGQHD